MTTANAKETRIRKYESVRVKVKKEKKGSLRKKGMKHEGTAAVPLQGVALTVLYGKG